MVIEARLKARLLGAPVLRVDGTVVVSPGRLVELTRGEVVDGAPRAEAGTNGGGPPLTLRPPGEDLDRARRLIADTDTQIASWHHR